MDVCVAVELGWEKIEGRGEEKMKRKGRQEMRRGTSFVWI